MTGLGRIPRLDGWRGLASSAVLLGIASYSAYVWQAPFTLLAWGNGLGGILSLFVGMPLVILGSYQYIERPLTRLGHRITRRQSPMVPAIIEVNQ
jgi:peptidoglycan/LPS O-acetylase OafA/YrhL